VTVVLLEDNAADARLVREALADDPAGAASPAGGFALKWVRSLAEASAHLDRGGADVVLTDLNLPESRGLETFRALHARHPGLPIVVLTGVRGDPAAISAVAEGAQDFLYKSELSGAVLGRLLRFAVERGRLERFKDEFLQNVGHELRTPVTVTYAALKQALSGAENLDPEQLKCLEMALRNTDRLVGLVEDLADCTRAREGTFSISPRRVPLAAALRETAEEMQAAAEQACVALTVTAPGPLCDAYADPRRLRQVLVNLVGNALKFTPAGGSVRVTADEDDADHRLLRVAVSDTGPGMTPEALSRVFERLYQGPSEYGGRRGLGLGLFIARQLVARQRGRLWAESAPGRGSTFFFTLPVFSLADWLAPLAAASGPLYLAAAELWPPAADPSPAAAAELAREGAAALAAALPEAVLLPEMAAQGAEGLLFLAARSRKPVKRDFLRRARRALAGCATFKSRGVVPAVSCAAVALSEPGGAPGYAPAAAEALAVRVRAALSCRAKAVAVRHPVR
jgi:signal transduction histidine kinase